MRWKTSQTYDFPAAVPEERCLVVVAQLVEHCQPFAELNGTQYDLICNRIAEELCVIFFALNVETVFVARVVHKVQTLDRSSGQLFDSVPLHVIELFVECDHRSDYRYHRRSGSLKIRITLTVIQ